MTGRTIAGETESQTKDCFVGIQAACVPVPQS